MAEPPFLRRPLSLSVVVPCRNAEGTLGEQLAALERAARHWPGELEVIVADNGSTDRSRPVAEGFRDRLPGLQVVAAGGRLGPGHSRNVGALAARGEGLLFCDADDRVDEGWIRALGEALMKHALVASRYDTARLNPPRARRPHPQETGLNPYTYPPYLPHAGGGGLGVLRDLHLAMGGFDESLPALEDTDYCFRLQRAGHRLMFVPEALVHVRLRGDLAAALRQSYLYGRYNVLIYRRYRPLGMPPLPWAAGLARWGKLLLGAPWALSRRHRYGWVAQLGWRLGRVDGSLRYRTWAL
jgi:glycosyltransferase involved in cell wall biosynthesis